MKEKALLETSDSRWIAASGLMFVAAWIVGLVIVAPPAATASTADLIAFYQANRNLAMLQTYLTNGLTGIALIVFAAALRSELRRLEGESSTLSSIIFLVGIGLLVGLWFPGLAAPAALLLVVEMVVAMYSHLVRGKDPTSELLPATVFLVLAVVVLATHWIGF